MVLSLLGCLTEPRGTLDLGAGLSPDAGEPAFAAAEARWAAEHPGVAIAWRARSVPALTVGAPAPPSPALPAGDVYVVDEGFHDLPGACFLAEECPVAGPLLHGDQVVAVLRREAPDARIVGLRVFDDHGGMRLVDLLRALDAVHLSGARGVVVNLSLGLAGPDGVAAAWAPGAACATANPVLAAMVRVLEGDGDLVVAAAGDGRHHGRIAAPACLPGVLAVRAGDLPQADDAPGTCAAPGRDVDVGGGLRASGSSLAAAAVAGRAARDGVRAVDEMRLGCGS